MSPRVLLVQPSINPPGGGNSVAAWILEALRDEHELSLLTWDPPRLDVVNRYFGTSLGPSDYALHGVAAPLRAAVDGLGVPLALVKEGLLRRTLESLHRTTHFDVMISANNEFDFGRPGIQYIHYPCLKFPRPSVDYRWYHRPRAVVPAYRALAGHISGASIERIRSNLTLVNSAFIAKEVRRTLGVEPRVVHPPVPGEFPDVPWESRQDGFLCVGRLSAEKEIEKVIEILDRVRERGHDVSLHLVGDGGSGSYAARIRELARERAHWIEMHTNLTRRELVELMGRNRYGLHGMVAEHFGIAVAELQRAGCLVFAPEEGGPGEILGGDSRLLYKSAGDAVDKIDRTLSDESLRLALRADACERRDRFSADRFMAHVRAAVHDFYAGPAASSRNAALPA